MKRITWLVLALIVAPLRGFVLAEPLPVPISPAVLRYLSPADGGRFVPPGTTLALRIDGPVDPLTLSATLFNLIGSGTGPHPGQAQLADDGATVVFTPNLPFRPGEQVAVVIEAGLATRAGAVFAGLRAAFSISTGGANPAGLRQALAEDELPPTDPAASGAVSAPAATGALALHPQDDVTFPDNFPAYTVTVPATGTAPGLLFLAPLGLIDPGGFLFIASDTGEPVFWQKTAQGGFDFKQQPDGTLTYFDVATSRYRVLDNTYTQIKTIAAANGYVANIHDLQILPDGHALFLIYDPQITDMSQFGGYKTAMVTGLIIQELDSSGLPVFQWDSWSHFALSDTYVSLMTPLVDYVHGNAIALDNDGNLLLSSRHLSEITKINRSSKDIIWRLGGKNNQFTIHDSGGPFSFQHDIRRLANGDLTIFDNHNPGPASRAVEYKIDENARVVTNTWQYQNSPGVYGFAMGDTQRLPDGHTLIGWGIGHPNVTEVLTDGTKVFELLLDPAFVSYRAFRFPWAAVPAWDPTLVLTGTITPTLYYSWNGATDVASYEIYGGIGTQPQLLLSAQARTGFEDHTALTNVPAGDCAFRVRPIDHQGQAQRFSNVVYRRTPCNAIDGFLPVIFGP